VSAASKPGTRRKGGRTQAQAADPYALYQQAVQSPEVDVRLFRRFYKERFPGSEPLVMREDFCAAASMACAWVKSSFPRVAHGVDLDPEPLEWGRQHNLIELKPSHRERVHLHQGDVRTLRTPPADVVNALNFSYCVFKQRSELRDYFRAAYANLKREGIFVIDLLGGYEVIQSRSDPPARHGSFSYIWEQHSFDPITHDGTYFIHFKFRDGSRMDRAFRYDWRLWTLPEVREVMREVGFATADVYWEGADQKGEGNGVWRRREHAEPEAAWTAYIVGTKRRSLR
jgi:SAM-dependent methyltransferase